MAFDNLALAIADSGMTAAEAFGEIDTSEDQLIDAPELQKGIEKIAGEKLSPKHVTAMVNEIRPSVSVIYSRIPRTIYSLIKLRIQLFKESLKTKNL